MGRKIVDLELSCLFFFFNFHFFDEKKRNIFPCLLGVSFCSIVNVPSCPVRICLSLLGAAGIQNLPVFSAVLLLKRQSPLSEKDGCSLIGSKCYHPRAWQGDWKEDPLGLTIVVLQQLSGPWI